MKAIILGASGLVGGSLLKLLLDDPRFSEILCFNRRPLGIDAPKLREVVLDFGRMAIYAPDFAADVLFCCLGSTIKKAGGEAAFRRADHDYPLEAARLFQAQNGEHFLLVSGLGANAASPFFYNRVKGEAENDLRALGLRRLSILRPSLLLGPRDESRPGEFLAQKVMPLFNFALPGGLRKYRAIAAKDVARAMVELVFAPETVVPLEYISEPQK